MTLYYLLCCDLGGSPRKDKNYAVSIKVIHYNLLIANRVKICANCVEFKECKEQEESRVELEVEKIVKQEMVEHHVELQGKPEFGDDAVNHFLEVTYEGCNSIAQ